MRVSIKVGNLKIKFYRILQNEVMTFSKFLSRKVKLLKNSLNILQLNMKKPLI